MSLPKHDDILTYDNWISYGKKTWSANKAFADPKDSASKALSAALKTFHSDYKKGVASATMLETVKTLQKAITKYQQEFKGNGFLTVFTTLIANPTARYEKTLNALVDPD